MYVITELEKSIAALKKSANDLVKVDNLTDFDALETSTQKIVFTLQMQANQVAGELVPVIMNKRTELQHANLNEAMVRVRAAQAVAKEELDEVKSEKETEVKDGGDSDRQQESKPRNRKPKSTKKTK